MRTCLFPWTLGAMESRPFYRQIVAISVFLSGITVVRIITTCPMKFVHFVKFCEIFVNFGKFRDFCDSLENFGFS